MRMLIIETIAKIRRLYHVKGMGIKTIARELALSKNTVKKIIRNDLTVIDYERKQPVYRSLANHLEGLKKKLLADKEEPKRRKRTVRKLFLELQSEGYQGSYDAVHAVVEQWRRDQSQAMSNAFVPLAFDPGEAFQFSTPIDSR
jgi:predicted DNA-binding protein YlxM (UPF0122 family)